MSEIFFTSDTHFCHNKNFIYAARGFSTIEDMNEAIIERWNKTVNPTDIIYHLGDVMLGDNELGLNCLKQLNGKIHIIYGNHCTASRIHLYETLDNIIDIKIADILKYKGYHLYLSHYPTFTGNYEDSGKALKGIVLNLYGHTHQTTNFYEDNFFMYHVGVDSHNLTPVSFEEIIEDIKNKRRESYGQK